MYPSLANLGYLELDWTGGASWTAGTHHIYVTCTAPDSRTADSNDLEGTVPLTRVWLNFAPPTGGSQAGRAGSFRLRGARKLRTSSE